MAGHSKWANIQHRKGRQDEKRGKVWTRVIREITVAARQGGADLAMNPRLRLAVDKAKAVNMPADTVKKNIDKATGNLEGVSYEEIRYEGYGIGGAAIIVDCMTVQMTFWPRGVPRIWRTVSATSQPFSTPISGIIFPSSVVSSGQLLIITLVAHSTSIFSRLTYCHIGPLPAV